MFIAQPGVTGLTPGNLRLSWLPEPKKINPILLYGTHVQGRYQNGREGCKARYHNKAAQVFPRVNQQTIVSINFFNPCISMLGSHIPCWSEWIWGFCLWFFSPLVLILGNPLSLAFSKDYSLATLLKISLTFFSLSQSKEATKSVDFAEVSWGSKESKNIECKSYLWSCCQVLWSLGSIFFNFHFLLALTTQFPCTILSWDFQSPCSSPY